jgi:hypothetical protein
MQQTGPGAARPPPCPAGRALPLYLRRPHQAGLAADARPRQRLAAVTAKRADERQRHEQSWIYRHHRPAGAGLLSSMLFVVDQRQFGVVYQLGQIKEVITEPGLNFKLPPPFQNVSLHRQAPADAGQHGHRAHADGRKAARGDRLVRALAHHRSAGVHPQRGPGRIAGAMQLNRVVRNAFQEEINKRTVKELLSPSANS